MKATHLFVTYKREGHHGLCHSLLKLDQENLPFGAVGAWIQDGKWVAGVFKIDEAKIPLVTQPDEIAQYPDQLSMETDFTIIPLR